jgi:itaconate CoA-transferase
MGFPFYYAAYGGALPERTGAKHATIAPYGPFQTADGSTIMIAVENDGDWARFCQAVLERPDLVVSLRFNSNSNRLRHRDELESIINTILGRLSDAEVVARLERAEVAYGRVRDASELGEHPQLKAMGRWRAVDSPTGPIRALLPPLYVNPNTEDSLKPIPSVGEHTDAILRELGLSDKEICELRCRGAI